jgi:hypothetical protein
VEEEQDVNDLIERGESYDQEFGEFEGEDEEWDLEGESLDQRWASYVDGECDSQVCGSNADMYQYHNQLQYHHNNENGYYPSQYSSQDVQSDMTQQSFDSFSSFGATTCSETSRGSSDPIRSISIDLPSPPMSISEMGSGDAISPISQPRGRDSRLPQPNDRMPPPRSYRRIPPTQSDRCVQLSQHVPRIPPTLPDRRISTPQHDRQMPTLPSQILRASRMNRAPRTIGNIDSPINESHDTGKKRRHSSSARNNRLATEIESISQWKTSQRQGRTEN